MDFVQISCMHHSHPYLCLVWSLVLCNSRFPRGLTKITAVGLNSLTCNNFLQILLEFRACITLTHLSATHSFQFGWQNYCYWMKFFGFAITFFILNSHPWLCLGWSLVFGYLKFPRWLTKLLLLDEILLHAIAFFFFNGFCSNFTHASLS